MIKINKKGLTGEAITWAAAFLIIFFIMIIFNALTLSFAGVKQATFSMPGGEIGIKNNFGEQTTASTENLAGILSIKTEYDGKQSIGDLVISMTDPFLSQQVLDNFALKSFSDLRLVSETKIAEWLILQKLKPEDEKKKQAEIIKAIDATLNNSCKEYFLKFPLGYLYKEKGKELILIKNIDKFSREYLLFFNDAKLKLNSRGFSFEVQYMESDYCE